MSRDKPDKKCNTKVHVPNMDILRKMHFFSPQCTRHRTPKMHDYYLWTVDYSYIKLATLQLFWFNLDDKNKTVLQGSI